MSIFIKLPSPSHPFNDTFFFPQTFFNDKKKTDQ